MNDFQNYNKKYSKLSLHKIDNTKVKTKNTQQGLKNMTNSNGLEISTLYGNIYQNSKKNIVEENSNYKHITNNNSTNKNLSFPMQTTSSNKNININSKYKDSSLINQKNNLFKKKYEKYLNNSKKDDSSNNYNSKENTNNNINIIKIINKNSMKLNIIPKKSNFKFISLKENNISLNNNKYIGKSISKSKSKSKSKNKRDNKSYNSKVSNNINKIIFDKYFKLYKIGEKGLGKKAKSKNFNILNKESSNFNINKYSNDINNSDIHKMSSLNMASNMQYKGLRKKNKSSNLLINNPNKLKNNNMSKAISNIIITKIESNNNKNAKKNKIDNYKNNKKYLTENQIMYIMNKKKSGMKKRNTKNNKEKQISSKDIKNNSNSHNTNPNNNNSNNYLNNYFINKQINNEKIIYDYKSNNNLFKKHPTNNNINENSKKNILNNIVENSDIMYKLNERLKTEYNENSLEAIDNMYEEENTEEINKKSLSFSKHGDSFRFLYPEIYIKDDEYNYDTNNKKEKELDETESPLKMDTDKISNENSGVLSFDQVKDIICYYNMNNTDKQSDFLFQKNERKMFDINYKSKYLNFFFGCSKNKDYNKNNNENNDLNDEIIYFNTNIKNKNPSSSIFSLDTEYSSKMKKKI